MAERDASVVPDGMTRDGDLPGMTCDAGLQRCEDGTRYVCVDGAEVANECPGGCARTGTGQCAVLAPSNIASGFGGGSAEAPTQELEVTGDMVFDTGPCDGGSFRVAEVERQAGSGPWACVVRVRSLEIDEGAVLTIVGDYPLILIAEEEIRIDGALRASVADEAEPWVLSLMAYPAGARLSGVSVNGQSLEFADGGGAGGSLCGRGGDGGEGRKGPGVTVAPGSALEPGGSLVPLLGGMHGGAGGYDGMIPPARGGVGGGAIQLSVNGILRVGPRGVINLSGAGGAGGTDTGAGNRVAGGGGGSGGALLIEALELEVAAGASIVANGGGGGSGARYTSFRDSEAGEPGAPGYPRDDWDSAPAPGGESVGDGSGRGGTGAAGMQTNGADGEGVDWQFGGNGGGGGGGAGCLQYRVPAGAAQISGAARISPSFTTMPPEFR